MLSFDELQKKYKDKKPQTVAGPSTEDPLYIKYREAVEAEKPKVAGGTVNPIISFGNVRENPVLKRKTNTTKTYSQALTESRNKAKVLENGAKLPAVIPPKGDVSKLILPDTGGGGTVNPTFKANEYRTNYDYMTDKEAAVYKYYRDRGQVEKAQAYLDALEMDVNQRAAMRKREDAKKLAEESTAAALYARAVGNIGQAAGAAYALAMEGADKPVDPYHPLMGGVNMNEGLYEGLMGESTGANKVVKDIGLGIFDWATQAAVLGPATPYVMAAGAMAGNTKDALERGGTMSEAVEYGVIGGAAEAATEKLGYDRLFKYGANAIAKKLGHAGLFELSEKIADKGALAKFLWEVMPHGVSEGLEEATSEFTNIVADTLVLGDNSQMKQIAQTAMENGATESEAVKTALQQGFLQVIYSGAIGAASGGVIAGGIGGLSRMTGRNTLEMAGNPVETARDAMTNAGNEVTQRTMKSRTRSEVPEGTQPETMLKEQGNVLPERENMLPEQGNVMVNRENTFMEQRQENKALRDFGEKYYYTKGQKVVNEEAERRGDTSFLPAFQTYYTAGLTGIKESDIKQTAETIVADKGLLSAAYLAGASDRKADLEARMKGTGKMGQTAGVFLETEAVTKEQRSLAELVSRVAKLEVVLVDELPQDRRGYYENNKGRVTIALNSGQFAGTLFHESVHFIRDASPEGFDRMRQAVFSAAAAMKGLDLETYTKRYEKMYGEAYQKEGREIDFDQILEEMVADAFAEVAGNEKAMRTLVTELKKENPSVLEKLKDFVDSLLKTLKSLVTDGRFSSFGAQLQKDIDFTEKLAKMLAEEMKTAGEKQSGERTNSQTEGEKVLYSIRRDARGKEYWHIDTQKDIFRGVKSTRELKKRAFDYILRGEKGKEVETIIHGKPLKFIRISAEEFVYGRQSQILDQNDLRKKMRMAPSVADLITHANVEWRAPDKKNHKAFSGTFLNYRGRVGIDDVIFDYVVRIGERKGKHIFYDINLEADPRVPGTEVRLPYEKNGLPLTVNISQNEKEGNGEPKDFYGKKSTKIADSSAQAAKMRPVFEVELSAEQIIAQDNGEENGKNDQIREGEKRREKDQEVFYDINLEADPKVPGTEVRHSYKNKNDLPLMVNISQNEKEGNENKYSLNENFAEAYDAWDKEQRKTFFIGTTSETLQSIGIEEKKIFWRSDKIRKIKEKHDGMTDEIIKQVPRILENPIIVMKSMTEESRIVMFGEVNDANGVPVLAAVELLPKRKEGTILNMQIIASAYGKTKKIKDFIERSEVLYLDPNQKRTNTWLQSVGLKLPSDTTKYGSIGSVAYEGNDVNITGIPYSDLAKHEKNVRFSLKEPIEETKDLIAVHNLTGEKLRKLLDLPGIPMPSIAITKSDAATEDFGEISLVFRKDTIDPADERNKVYDADAWTPMFPMLDKEEYGKTRAFLEELVRTMQAQTKSGKNAQGFMGENTMRAAMSNRFVSLGEIKEAREKLEHLPKEEFEALREEMNQRLFEALEKIYDTGSQTGINEVYEMEDIGEQIQNMAEEVKGVPSAQQIQQNLKKAGYPISMELAEQTARVLEEIKEMPTDFFEAKPERVVEFAEVAAAVVPDDLEVDLRKAVENKIPQVLEYEAGSRESRVRQLNRVEGVRFSIRETEDGKDAEDLKRTKFKLKEESSTAVVGNDTVNAIQEDSSGQRVAQREREVKEVSYARLIQKPDMRITYLDSKSMDGKERQDAVEKAKESVREKKNPHNTDQVQYIYCKDIKKDIQVGKRGIVHALQRKWKESAVALTKLGDLLENAILINELEPREGVKRAYVLLGYGEDENGAGYPTYFVVNEYPTGNVSVEDLAVLYSSKTQKMEPYANNASMIAGKDPLLTPGSTISIEELLEKVNAMYSDILSQDVADHFGNTRRKTKLGESVLFSIREDDISYDRLIQKADMPIVKLDSHAMDGKKRKDIYPMAKQSVRARNHSDNTEEKQYIYNADIDRKILVGRGGIEHSLQRKWEETAVMMTKLGEILENAIEINRVEPREGVKDGYVLLGYGEDEQGNGYPAYFVVNRYPDGTNRLEWMDVLYSAKAKKIEPSANPIKNGNAAKARGGFASSLSGSTISIEELLEKVNVLYSDILPQSVADHFDNTRRKTKLGESVLFSIREEAYDALVEENEVLKEANEALRRQFEITKDAVHDPVSAKKAIRKWLKAHDSEYDVDDFTEKFVALADYVANAGDRVDFQKVMGALQKLAYDALSESKVLNTELSDAYKDFKDDVRKTKIKVTDSMLEELEYYGGYIEFRKRNFGKLNLSRQGGIPADVFYQEMAEKYPGILEEGNVKTQVDILIDLANTVDSLQPIYENPYGMNLDEYAMDAAYDLWEMYFDIEMQKPTFADKYEKKLEKEKARARAARENLRKDLKERYDEKLQQAKEDQKKKLEDARLAAAMHEGRALVKQRRAIYEKLKARDKERRDRAEYAKYRNIIEKEAALLKRWVERPTDQYHVQESMMEGVRNFLEKMKFDDPDLNIMPTDIRRMMKDYQAMTAENTMLYAEEDENVQAMLESLADSVGDSVKVSELGPTEMRQLSVVIRSVSHLVRNANKMVSIKNGQKISTIGNAYMDDVQNKKTKNPDSRLRVLSDMMNVQMLDTESFFKEMGKTVHDTIYRGLREGFDRKILHVKEAAEFMRKTAGKKKIREWGEMEPKEYTLSGGKILLTDAQIMSLYCLMRRTQARGHIFGGGIKGEPVVHKVRGERKIVKNTEPVEVTAADVTKLMSNLTEEQKKVALEIQGYLESVASWGNEVTMNMLGYKKFTETNYFPIVTDENYIKTMYGARGEKNSTLQTMGITKQTNREAKNPIILENIFDAYVKHIDQMSSFNAFVPALSDLNKFMNYREMVRVVDGKKFGENRSVKETMQRVMGPAGDKYVRDLMERLNNPAVKEDVERLPRIFLRNMKIASVGANLRVIIQQPVSYLRAADEIGVGYLMGALVPSKTDFEKVYEYAPIAQWKEWGNYEMNVGRTMKELLVGQNFYESFLEKSMIVAGIMDKLTWGRIWRAAELEVKKKHPELTGNRYYETVGKRFSEIIDGTQVVDSILHRNQMMRSQSLFSQMATSFMSEPTKTYNMMRNSMVAVMKDNTPENRKKVVRTFMTLVANGVCVAAAAGLVDMLRDDDDDETLLEKWLQAFRGDFSEAESVSDYILAAIGSNLGNSFNPLGYIPYMRDIFSVIQGYTVQRTDISWLNDLVKSGKNLMRYMEGDSNYTLNAVLMDAAGSLSKATGIPINSAKRDIMAIKNTIVNYTLGLDAQYENQKLTYDVGSEKNISMYVKMMLEAKMSGNEQIATRIYNDMVNGGISNEKIDNKIKTEQVKAIKEEPEAMEAAKAYNEGRVDDYTRNVEVLAKKGYFMANIESAVESLTKPPTEDEETFETITKDYWKEEGEVESADYALLFNAYMNGNMADYDKMWSILNAAGKEDKDIRSSMRSRLKSEYWKAKEAGDSQRMQRAADEFYRLGGKRETLEKAPQ